jgi:hypothetical protein
MYRKLVSSSKGLYFPCAAFFGIAMLTLTGCGIGPASVDNPGTISPSTGRAMGGTVHGGSNPVIGMTVTLWSTLSNNTGAAGYPNSSNTTTSNYCPLSSHGSSCTSTSYTSAQLAQTTTDANGHFSFSAGSYTCPSGQFAYVTGTGGNTGGNTTNNQAVFVAALGSCSRLDNSTDEGNIVILMSEVSTVAAAYSLSNFMYVNDNGAAGTQLAFISAPANNNASSGSCTVTSNYITSCAAAGLSHAFANALNLVDAVHFDGTTPTGQALAAPASNSSAIAPQALINSIGNTLQACTNSAGGDAGDSTPCGNLFSYTTLTASSPATYTSTSTPANELAALLNMVKAPTNNAASIFNLGSTIGFFNPALTAAPTDLTLTVWYPSTTVSSASTPLGWPIGVTIDANDDVYVLRQDIQTTPTGSALAAFASNGAISWGTGLNTSLCDPVNLAADANGYLWYANHEASNGTCPGNGTAGAAAGIYGFTSTGPTITSPNYTISSALTGSSPNNVAIDRHNNVWLSKSSSTQSIDVFPPPYTSLPSLPKYNITSIDGISIDSNQNGWAFSSTAGSTGSLWVLPNQGSPAAQAYGTSSTNFVPTTAFTSIHGQSATSGPSTGSFDSSGNAWVASNLVVSKVTPSSVSPSVTSPVSYPVASFACSTCTLLTFTYSGTQSTSIALTQYAVASGFTTAKGQALNNNAFIISSSTTTALAKTALCNSTGGSGGTSAPCTLALTTACSSGTPCAAVSTTTDAGAITVYPVSNSFASSTSITTSAITPANIATDGVNSLWLHDNAVNGTLSFVVPGSSVAQTLNPCYLPSAATTCQTGGGMGYGGRLAIDSTGSVWTVSGTTGSLIQVIGSAAPAWPLLAYTQPGLAPQ